MPRGQHLNCPTRSSDRWLIILAPQIWACSRFLRSLVGTKICFSNVYSESASILYKKTFFCKLLLHTFEKKKKDLRREKISRIVPVLLFLLECLCCFFPKKKFFCMTWIPSKFEFIISMTSHSHCFQTVGKKGRFFGQTKSSRRFNYFSNLDCHSTYGQERVLFCSLLLCYESAVFSYKKSSFFCSNKLRKNGAKKRTFFRRHLVSGLWHSLANYIHSTLSSFKELKLTLFTSASSYFRTFQTTGCTMFGI